MQSGPEEFWSSYVLSSFPLQKAQYFPNMSFFRLDVEIVNEQRAVKGTEFVLHLKRILHT